MSRGRDARRGDVDDPLHADDWSAGALCETSAANRYQPAPWPGDGATAKADGTLSSTAAWGRWPCAAPPGTWCRRARNLCRW